MAVKKGYKQTQVGVIPEDWKCSKLRQICEVIRGASPRPKGDPRYYGGAIPRLMVEDVTRDGKTVFPCIDFLTEEGAKRSRPCKKGTLTIVCSGTVGIASFLGVDACIHDGFLAIVRLHHGVFGDYLYYQLCRLREHFDSSATHGGIFTNLTTFGVREFAVPIAASLAEQEAIAGALSDADAWIESLEQLIAKKRQIKQGAMQELLTGKRRLPGFEVKRGYTQTEVGVIPEDWTVQKLIEISVRMTNGFVGPAIRHYTTSSDGVLYIQGYNIEENSFNFHGIKYVTSAFHNANTKSCLRIDDMLTVQTGDVGLTTVVTEDLVGSNCHALIITRFIGAKVNSRFISYYLNSKSGRARMRLIETGTTMKHLNVGDLLQFMVSLPHTLAEQTAIATVLSDMDTEIESLESKLAKAREIKQGMMQELLTGKIRLV